MRIFLTSLVLNPGAESLGHHVGLRSEDYLRGPYEDRTTTKTSDEDVVHLRSRRAMGAEHHRHLVADSFLSRHRPVLI